MTRSISLSFVSCAALGLALATFGCGSSSSIEPGGGDSGTGSGGSVGTGNGGSVGNGSGGSGSVGNGGSTGSGGSVGGNGGASGGKGGAPGAGGAVGTDGGIRGNGGAPGRDGGGAPPGRDGGVVPNRDGGARPGRDGGPANQICRNNGTCTADCMETCAAPGGRRGEAACACTAGKLVCGACTGVDAGAPMMEPVCAEGLKGMACKQGDPRCREPVDAGRQVPMCQCNIPRGMQTGTWMCN